MTLNENIGHLVRVLSQFRTEFLSARNQTLSGRPDLVAPLAKIPREHIRRWNRVHSVMGSIRDRVLVRAAKARSR